MYEKNIHQSYGKVRLPLCDKMVTMKEKYWDFPGSPVVKASPSNDRDVGLIHMPLG